MIKMATETKEPKSIAQRRQELKAKLEQLDAQVEKEAMDGINDHLAALADIGKPHLLISQEEYAALKAATAPKTAGTTRTPKTGKTSTPKAAPGPSANYDENKECPICKMKSHDGRAHRSQDPKKKFTDSELSERGLLPPGSIAVEATR